MKSSNGRDQHQLNHWQEEPEVWRVEVHRLVDLWQAISEVKGDYYWAGADGSPARDSIQQGQYSDNRTRFGSSLLDGCEVWREEIQPLSSFGSTHHQVQYWVRQKNQSGGLSERDLEKGRQLVLLAGKPRRILGNRICWTPNLVQYLEDEVGTWLEHPGIFLI